MSLDILQVGVDHILHFEAIVRNRALKAAASELNLSQPAVSHSLNKLEENLGLKLCIRSRSEFVLTDAGAKLFETAQNIKNNLLIYQSYLDNSDEFSGIFRVGIIGEIVNLVFEQLIVDTVQQFPNMTIDIQIYTAERIIELISSGEIDLGFGLFKSRKNYSSLSLGKERIRHYISEYHPLWKRRSPSRSDVKNLKLTWLDIVSRNKRQLESEIFIKHTDKLSPIGSYANGLQAATLLLRTGKSIVPFPEGYLESRKLDFNYKSLDKVFKPYEIDQTVIYRPDLIESSMPSSFFIEKLSEYRNRTSS